MRNYAYLMFSDDSGYYDGITNHNKFYKIIENDDYSIDVFYGRVGKENNPQTKHYASYEKDFYSLKKSKLQKGYTDVTYLHAINDEAKTQVEYKEIELPSAKELMDYLLKSQIDTVNSNYTIKMQDVTQLMIDTAKEHLTELYNKKDEYSFNNHLKKLFNILPRKMKSVSENLMDLSNKNNFEEEKEKIIKREKELLESIESVFEDEQKKSNVKTKDVTILEENKIDICRSTYDEEDKIFNLLIPRNWENKTPIFRVGKIFSVKNETVENNFLDYCKKNNIKSDEENLYFHGSKVGNIWSIVKSGLKDGSKTINGKAFGGEHYFADKAQKSMGYVDIVNYGRWNKNTGKSIGYLLVFDVKHNGYNDFIEYDAKNKTINGKPVSDRKHFRDNEIVVSKANQTNIRYIIEIDSRKNEYPKTIFSEKEYTNIFGKFKNSFGDLYKENENVISCVLDISNLDKNLHDKYFNYFNSDKVKVLYDTCSDTISFEDKLINLPNFDKAILQREMKRTFVNSEDEWLKLVKENEKVKQNIISENKNVNKKVSNIPIEEDIKIKKEPSELKTKTYATVSLKETR